jgi:hypothetical protein
VEWEIDDDEVLEAMAEKMVSIKLLGWGVAKAYI